MAAPPAESSSVPPAARPATATAAAGGAPRVDPVKARIAFLEGSIFDEYQGQATDTHRELKRCLVKCSRDVMEIIARKRATHTVTINADGTVTGTTEERSTACDDGCRIAFMDLMIQAMGRLETGLAIPHYKEPKE